MEATAQSVEDQLVNSLSFKLNPGASYVTNRRSVTYYPHGGNSYSSNGVKVIKLMLTGSDWLDPGTVRLVFDVACTDSSATNSLLPISGPWGLFRRLRILCGGQVVEDIDNYARTHEMFSLLQPRDTRENDDIEGFGNGLPNSSTNSYEAQYLYDGIPAGSSVTVSMRFLSGLLNQDKFLPIRYCPITIELELCNQMTDPFTIEGVVGERAASQSWLIQNVMLKADVVSLDNSLDNEYAQHLLEGKSLPINYSSYTSQLLSLQSSGGTFSANVTRSFTRLKSVFATFYNNNRVTYGDLDTKFGKDWNYFYHPMATADSKAYDPANEMELQIQVGSKLMPEYPVRSTKEAFYQLRKCLGIHGSTWHNISCTEIQYRTNRFIFGIDCEKMLSAGFTGLNTKAGDLMTVRAKCLGAAAKSPDSMYVVLHSDQILNIKDSGVEVLE